MAGATQGTQGSISGSEQTRPTEESTYTVQRKDGYNDVSSWTDIATITVAARTKRRTIIERALEEAGLDPKTADEMKVRVLDEASAREVPVTTKNRDPEWEIG